MTTSFLRPPLRVVLLIITAAPLAQAVPATALRETLEIVTRKFGRESLGEGAQAFLKRIDDQAARFGQDNVLKAVTAVGPSALRTAAKYGDDAGAVYRVLGRHGAKAARICDDPALARLFIRHGDEAAEAMIKHPGLAARVLESHGSEAARALVKLNRTNGGRLARLHGENFFAATPAHRGLFGVIERFGDRGLDFIWRHKAVLLGGAVLAAFLADPEPYLDGVAELGAGVAEAVVGKVGETANWNILVPAVLAVLALAALALWWLRGGKWRSFSSSAPGMRRPRIQ